jgi:hypothetical protein
MASLRAFRVSQARLEVSERDSLQIFSVFATESPAKVSVAFLGQPSQEGTNLCNLIWKLEVCIVVWVRETSLQDVLWAGVGRCEMLATKIDEILWK